jgi:hypothetical protein
MIANNFIYCGDLDRITVDLRDICGMKNMFRQTQQYTVLTLGIGTMFTDQLPTFHVLKKVHTMMASKFQQSAIKSEKSYE